MKKGSAMLIILSVIGNFLCLFNIVWVEIFFEKFKQNQVECFIDDYDKDNIKRFQIGIECFDKWVNSGIILSFWRPFADFNGLMIMGFSEPLALIPYLLRSLRIKQLFDARELYCDTDRIPKEIIWKW